MNGSLIPERIETVVVPLDGSQLAATAVPVAARLARRLDAAVHLLSTVETVDEVERRDAELAAVRPDGLAVERTVVVDRDPAGEIHETVRRLGPAVACMASHGRGRSAAFLGSVANDVVRRGRDPVVVVGPLVDARRWGRGVVGCVDDTPVSAALVDVTLGWADVLRQAAIVLTVAEPVPDPVGDWPARRRFGPDGDPEAFLDELVAPVRALGSPVATYVVYDPVSPAEGVRVYLRERGAMLAVIGSHARVGLERLVAGSIAAAVVRGSPSPVLIVPRCDER